MSKLVLNPEELVVQSFPTTDVRAERGTVRGMDSGPTCDQDTCVTCANTCTGCSVDGDTCVTCASCPTSCASCPVSCNPAQCPSADGRC